MSRLIDADVLMESLNDMKVSGETFVTAVEFAKKIIKDAPTVCVPQDTPLRCRTCSFFVSTGEFDAMSCLGGCLMFGGARKSDDYCSQGAWISNAL